MDIISWITFAKRPLSPLELLHALAMEINQPYFDIENLSDLDYMVSLCVGLVTIDQESNVVRLMHYTTQEYFASDGKKWFRDGQRKIAEICITYLCFDDFENGCYENNRGLRSRLQAYPLYDYAAHHWGHHA